MEVVGKDLLESNGGDVPKWWALAKEGEVSSGTISDHFGLWACFDNKAATKESHSKRQMAKTQGP